MIRAYAPALVRAAERALLAGLPHGELMRRAASGLAHVLRGLTPTASGDPLPAVVLVGPGDNGGDALFAAAAWARSPGAHVRIRALCLPGVDAVHEDGAAAARAAGVDLLDAGDPRSLGALAGARLVVDGILGIGGRPGLMGRAADLVRAIPPGATVVAVDLPSGADPEGRVVSADTPGEVVRADVTVTFGCAKPVHLLPGTEGVIGRLLVVDIGLDLSAASPVIERCEDADLAARYPVPGRDDDKYTRGVLGVVAGSERYPGAAVLVTTAAVGTGVGMVRYVGPPAPTGEVLRASPEVVPGPGRVQAYALGSGLDPRTGPGEAPAEDVAAQAQAVRQALASDLPCLVDAGGLDLLDVEVPRAAPTLLTPHVGELARLWSRIEGRGRRGPDDVRSDPVGAIRAVAAATGAVVLLKGATTLVGGADGVLRSQAASSGFLATAGSGDVLAGIAGALLATGCTPLDAGTLAAAVHGAAALVPDGVAPVHASALPAALGPTVSHLLKLRHGAVHSAPRD